MKGSIITSSSGQKHSLSASQGKILSEQLPGQRSPNEPKTHTRDTRLDGQNQEGRPNHTVSMVWNVSLSSRVQNYSPPRDTGTPGALVGDHATTRRGLESLFFPRAPGCPLLPRDTQRPSLGKLLLLPEAVPLGASGSPSSIKQIKQTKSHGKGFGC